MSAASAWRRRATTERSARAALRGFAAPHRRPICSLRPRAPCSTWSACRSTMRCSRVARAGRARRRAPGMAGPPGRSRAGTRAACRWRSRRPRSIVPGHRSQRVGAVRGSRRARSVAVERPRGGPGCGSAAGRRGGRELPRRTSCRSSRNPRRSRASSALPPWNRSPKLRALLDAAATRGLPHVVDESELTLGAGAGGRSFSLTALPDAADVPWDELRDIPTAIVTGSNGKTTTVRLLAACARATAGTRAYNCTDGVFLDDEALAPGDYSGPAGARMVLRERRAAGGHSRDCARRHLAPWNRGVAGRHRRRHQREFRSFRRIRHRRSCRPGGSQARGGGRRSARRACWC